MHLILRDVRVRMPGPHHEDKPEAPAHAGNGMDAVLAAAESHALLAASAFKGPFTRDLKG